MSEKNAKIAVIRIKGQTKIKKEIKDTLNMLGLYKKFTCVVVDAVPSIIGMIKRVKDYVSFGEIDEETLNLLKNKRGKKTIKEGKEVYKKFFRLQPPKGGFKGKGTKVSFKAGGALGDRKEKINDLIKSML